jgi:hypothetical protein
MLFAMRFCPSIGGCQVGPIRADKLKQSHGETNVIPRIPSLAEIKTRSMFAISLAL